MTEKYDMRNKSILDRMLNQEIYILTLYNEISKAGYLSGRIQLVNKPIVK